MLPVEYEQKIRALRIPGLLRAIASAENRAAVAETKGKDAAPAREEAQRLRAELERLVQPAQPQPIEEDADEVMEAAVVHLQRQQAIDEARELAREAAEEERQGLLPFVPVPRRREGARRSAPPAGRTEGESVRYGRRAETGGSLPLRGTVGKPSAAGGGVDFS